MDLEPAGEDSGPQSKKAFQGEWEAGALEGASESLVEHIFHVLVRALALQLSASVSCRPAGGPWSHGRRG